VAGYLVTNTQHKMAPASGACQLLLSVLGAVMGMAIKLRDGRKQDIGGKMVRLVIRHSESGVVECWWLAENIKSDTSFYGLELKLETNLDFKGKSQMF